VIGFDWISRSLIAALVVEERNPTQPTVTFLTSTQLHNLLIASLLGFSTLFAGSYPLVKAQSVKNVPFEVCFNSDTFVIPSAREQGSSVCLMQRTGL